MITLLTFIAIALYLLLLAMLTKQATAVDEKRFGAAFLLGCIALFIHSWVNHTLIITPNGIELGFFTVASLISWFIVLTTLFASLRLAIDRLLIPLYGLAAITLLCTFLFPSAGINTITVTTGIASHIIMSILAYSILTIAAVQAAALWLQHHALKSHQTRGIINILPPMQTMELLLFQMLTSGTLLLLIAIVTGIVFIDDIFAQHLVHKTFFSFIALIIFAILLWGRHQKGWRGYIAIRWTLTGFAALMLGYFGSKFVLELVLQR